MSAPLKVHHLAAITVAAMVNLRNLPLIASTGWSSVMYYLLAAILFLLPTAYVCAELGSRLPYAGGVYAWVRAAFGPVWAFLVGSSAWAISIVWYPAALAFGTSAFFQAIGYVPEQHPHLFFWLTQSLLWGASCLSLRGFTASAPIMTTALVGGTILPALAMMLSALMLWQYDPSLIQPLTAWENPIRWSHDEWALLSGVILGLGGIEVAGFHVHRLKHPRRDYTRALYQALLAILIISIGGTLAIAALVPEAERSIMAGSVQIYHVLASHWGQPWLERVFCGAIICGMLASLTAWMISPAQGMLAAHQDQILPAFWAKLNKHGMPYRIILLQSSMATILSLCYVYWPRFEQAYWFLSLLMVQLSCFLYTGLYVTLWQLRRCDTPKQKVEGYRIPGGSWGYRLCIMVGTLTSVALWTQNLYPVSWIGVSTASYVFLIGLGPFLMMIPSLWWAHTHWRNKSERKK